MYFNNILKKVEEDYENEEIDIHSLAMATKKYIKENVRFFDQRVYGKIYDTYLKNQDKSFLLQRIPFLMINRMVFKLVVNIIDELDKNKIDSGVDRKASLKIWADSLICSQRRKSPRADQSKDFRGFA